MNANSWDFDLDMINSIFANSCLTENSSRIFLGGASSSVYDIAALKCFSKCFKSIPELNYAELEAVKGVLTSDYHCRCFKNIPGTVSIKKAEYSRSIHCWESDTP